MCLLISFTRRKYGGVSEMYCFLPTILLSVVFFIIYVLSVKHPSVYGSRTGYNTVTSRKSKKVWDYAQKLANKYMRKFLSCSIIYNLIGIIVYLSIRALEWVSSIDFLIFNCIVSLLVMVSYFLRVEYELKLAIREGRI